MFIAYLLAFFLSNLEQTVAFQVQNDVDLSAVDKQRLARELSLQFSQMHKRLNATMGVVDAAAESRRESSGENQIRNFMERQ